MGDALDNFGKYASLVDFIRKDIGRDESFFSEIWLYEDKEYNEMYAQGIIMEDGGSFLAYKADGDDRVSFYGSAQKMKRRKYAHRFDHVATKHYRYSHLILDDTIFLLVDDTVTEE